MPGVIPAPAGGLPRMFDAHHPPAEALIRVCVHCGFCLPACPTYRLWGREMDSPRGRLYLMQLGLEGEIPLDATVAGHFDACLGCRACVTACPCGVDYGKLLDATRAQLERRRRRRRGERFRRGLLLRLISHPRLLRVAAVGAWAYRRLRLGQLARRVGVFRRLPPALQALEELVPSVPLRELCSRAPRPMPASGPTVARVGVVTGCVQSVFFGRVNRATVRVLAAEGYEVVVPRAQGCCGALALGMGDERRALEMARRMMARFERAGVERVVVDAAGCGSVLKEYGHLLRDAPDWARPAAAFSSRVCDVTELLDERPARATRHPLPVRVVYLDACHLAHAQGIRAQPRRQLAAIPGLTVLEVADSEICCGSAGIYNLTQVEPATELGRRKVAAILEAAPEVVVTGNPGCALQVRRHLDDATARIPVVHPIEVVDASIRGLRFPLG